MTIKGDYKKPPPGWKKPTGFCECGCKQRTKKVSITSIRRDQYAGYFMRYTQGHSIANCSKGPGNPRWKGGRWKHKTGYIYVSAPEHPHANRDGYVFEHRLVYEQHHGILLDRKQLIHHVNGRRDDNRIENLERMDRAKHAREHDELGKWRKAHPRLARRTRRWGTRKK